MVGRLNIISVISVNQHRARVLPFPYFGQTPPNSCATVFEPPGASLSLQPFGRLVTTSTNASSNSNFEIHVSLVWIVRCLVDSKLQYSE